MKKQMQAVAKKAVKAHEDSMHKGVKKMAKGGYAAKKPKNPMRMMKKRGK